MSSSNTQPNRNAYTPPSTDWQSFVQDPRLRQLIDPASDFDFDAIDPQTKDTIRTCASDFDAQVASLEQTIAQLTAQRDLLVSLSHRLKSFVSPIDILPDEVLVGIIQLCINAGWTYRTHGHVTMFRLTQVCRRWRRLVVASPLLWSHIDLEWDGFHSEGEPCSLAASAFHRAQHVPLHIEIDAASRSNRPSIAGILEGSLHLCRRLDITTLLTSAKQHFEALRLDRRMLPLLEDLHLNLVYSAAESQGLGFISNCPKLTRLYVAGAECDIRVWVPWHQLTTLSWNVYASFDGIFGILTLTERLETLEIRGKTFDKPEPDSDYQVTLAHLKSLKVDWQRELMHFICCPALEDLTITGIAPDVATALLVRSKPPLKVFHLLQSTEWGGHPNEATVGSILILEEFMVTECLGRLAKIIEYCGIPLTKTLTLKIPNPIDEICSNGNAIISFLRSFRMANSGLQTFKLLAYANRRYDSSGKAPECRSRERIRASPFFQSLEAMRLDGLKVIVSYSPSTDPDDEASREYY